MTSTKPEAGGFFSRISRIFTYPKRAKHALDAHTRQLQQQDVNLRQLESRLAQLEQNHQASVDWLQQTYPEIVSAIGKKLEQPQLDELARDLFSAVHREISTRQFESGHKEATSSSPTDPALYLDLERSFRGKPEEIREKLRPYLDRLQSRGAASSPVLDIGCGGGEWLALLKDAGLEGQGVDLNPINGAHCRAQGLKVETANALDYLAALPENSIGTVTAFHLVEHLTFDQAVTLTDHILRVLKPGGLLIYETPNPENLLVATRSFWIDPTHLRPLPPPLLEFLVAQRGLQLEETLRLHPGESSSTDPALQALLCAPRDYAVIARKPDQS